MDAWSLGRTPTALEPPYSGEDEFIAAVRADGTDILGAQYSHVTFANCSFLEAKIRSGKFLNCVFVECYFRRSELKGSTFVGCKFINCNFSHSIIQSCDFKYAEFRGSAPPFNEMQHSAPPEPNLREELFWRLASAADTAGNHRDSRAYRLAAISAQDQHLRAAVRLQSQWYKDHYDLVGRLGALSRLGWHKLNKYLWGHGESAWRLLVSALAAVALVFPAAYYLTRGELMTAAGEPTIREIFWLSLSNFLLLDRLSLVELVSSGSRTIAAIQSLTGIVFAGMFVTLLVKALLRR